VLLAIHLPAAEKPPATLSRPAQARVVIIERTNAMENFTPHADAVQAMMERGLVAFSGKPSAAAAWRSLVTTQDTVGVKVFSGPGPVSGTRPAVVEAVVRSLLAAGLRPSQIIIWDKHRTDLRQAGFIELATRLGVGVEAAVESGFDEKVFYESALLGQLIWGDHEFGKQAEGVGRKSFVSKLVTQRMTKIINLPPLLNHNQTGVSGNLFSLAIGSVDNTIRFENDASRLATTVPEIYALPELSDRVIVNIVDALLCQYQGEERGLLHYSSVLNQLRFSSDPVALDVLSLEELEHQRQIKEAPKVRRSFSELYDNAALLELGVSRKQQIKVERVN
jgi:uncharacterized protein (DUF362 family)